MTSLTLILGLGALGLALVIGVVAMLSGARATNDVLATIDAYYGRSSTAPGARQVGLPDLPPVLDRMRGLAARLSPGNVLGKMQHRLDVAGNPGKWTPERVLAYKGVGLFG